MKKMIAAVLLVVMVLTVCVSAFAWTETWTINPKDGGNWKKSSTNHTMPDSGSYWKATFDGPANSSSAYIYKKSTGRATHIEDFTKGTERTRLNYLEGMKIVGDTYWIVGKGTYGTKITYTYSF